MQSTTKFFIGKNGLSASVLKTLAIMGMTLDHIGIIFSDYLSLEWRCILYALGGLTFPIMAYLLCEGYRKTSNFKKYALRLFGFALLAQIPFFLMAGLQLNVIFTLFLGLMAIHLYETMENRSLYWLTFIGIVIFTVICDWGVIGVPMILMYYTIKDKKMKLVLPLILPLALLVIPTIIIMTFTSNLNGLPSVFFVLIGCSLTIPLLWNYNGEKGKSIKYFFYIYYPLHLLILSLIKYLFF